MTTVKDVAQFFIMKGLEDDEENGISNLKLQKLLYYAKGYSLAILNNSFFTDSFYAWRHGPVIPDMYHEYKKYGSNPITDQEYDPLPEFNADQLELLNEVWSVFGQFSGWKLRDMTHSEKPWLDHEASASMIPDRELADYFKTRLH